MSSDTSTWRGTVQRVLRVVSHAPTPFISTFILIHLSAPVVASVGGTDLSSKVMLLGREYYQSSYEPFLVYAPIFLHVSASVLKRLTSPKSRPLRSLLSASAYGFLAFLPIHILIHRGIPASPDPPVMGLSPGELDFEYVKYALHNWPVRSFLLYGGLVGAWAMHALEGANVLKSTWIGGGGLLNTKTRRIISMALIAAVSAGLLSIWREPLRIFTGLASRYHASFTQAFVYRI